MAAKNLKSRANTATTVIALVGGVIVVALLALLVWPQMAERGTLSDQAARAEKRAEQTRAELARLEGGDQTAAELAARASAVDSYFRYFDPVTVREPVNEVNLVYQELFDIAVAETGISRDNVRYSFPASAANVKTPAGLGAASLHVSLIGTPDTPRQLLDALQRQQVLATVSAVKVTAADSPLPEPSGPGNRKSGPSAAPAGGADITSSGLMRFDMTLLIWFTTVPPVDFSPPGAAPGG